MPDSVHGVPQLANRISANLLTALAITLTPWISTVAYAAPGAEVGGSQSSQESPGPPSAAATALHELLDQEWEWRAAQFPESATEKGDHRFDDRLTDRSAAAVALRREHHREFLTALRGIDHTALQGEDRISWEVFSYFADLAVREDQLLLSMSPKRVAPWSADDSPFSLNQMDGPQLELPLLVRSTQFRTADDYAHYLARLKALPTALAQLQDILDAGRVSNTTPPQVALARIPGQFAALADSDPEHNPLFAPFREISADVPAERRTALRLSAEQTLRDSVVPAFQRFRSYLADVWIPGARRTLAANDLPHGREYYALSIERSTTLHETPAELHDLGLREVARIDQEMRAVMKQTGFSGTLADFRKYLRTDPRFQFASAAEELTAFRDPAKRVDAELPSLFVQLPRLPYGVRSMAPEEGNNAPHYVAGALDGTRAGYFEANTNNLASWPRWTIEALFLHEAVPGHHLQIARGQEIPGLPRLRRGNGNYAFNEGWGLYAEGLGKELGLYADPYAWFGRLSLDSLRASRLVVDTGLHSLGWSRDQAIEYLIAHAQLERGFAEAEVDRYLVWPGQATSYKVGEQEILSLRARAKAELGANFDIRRFHNAVIDHGSIPLPVLREVVGSWIEAERSKSAPQARHPTQGHPAAAA